MWMHHLCTFVFGITPNTMSIVASHQAPAPRLDDNGTDWWKLKCPSSLSFSTPAGSDSSPSTAQCPFASSSSTTTHPQPLLPSSHPPVPGYLATRLGTSNTPGVSGASDILPILPSLNPTTEEDQVKQGNFAHLFSQDLDKPSLALQHALGSFRAKTGTFATDSYDKAFNWTHLVS